MISFFKYLVIIFLVIFVSAITLDVIYSYLLTRPSNESTLKRAFSLKNEKLDLVFFGSSRVVNNIDCYLISKLTGRSCLNMGSMGSTSKYDAFIFEVLLSNNNTIKEAFFQVDYKYNDLNLGNHFKADLIPFSGIPLVDRYLKEEKNDYILWNIPFYRYMINDKVIGIRKTLVPKASFFRREKKDGFIPLEGTGTLIKVKLPMFYSRNSNSELYKNIEGADSVLINYFTAPFCNNIENRNELDNLKTLFDNYTNYTKLFDNNQEYFNNCLHLNALGAKVFSTHLSNEISKNKRNKNSRG